MYLFIKSGTFCFLCFEFIFHMNIYASGIQLTVLDTYAFFISLEMSPIYSNARTVQIT